MVNESLLAPLNSCCNAIPQTCLHLQQGSILQGKHLWWKHLKRYYCTLRNARVHLEMGTVTEKLQLDQSGIKEFANSNTCCPGVEDQWQGRAPSDILTSESKQLNVLNLHSHVDVWNGAWLISKRDNTNVHECDQLLNAFKFPPVRDVANAYAQCRAVFSTDL